MVYFYLFMGNTRAVFDSASCVPRSFKSADSFYSEFQSKALPAAGTTELLPSAVVPSAKHAPVLEPAHIVQRVAAAVRAVLGAEVGPEQPLVAAGLDSLGTPPVSF